MGEVDDGFAGRMADLYDLFVDWKGRLGREMPGLVARLRAVDARRVLDVGCGTGRHLQALLDEGFDAHGADASADMLAHAREWTGAPERLVTWRMGDPVPDGLERLAPFDAITCLGNTWPQLTDDDDIAAAARSLRGLLRPGGLLLMGLKAVARRLELVDPFLPLLRREQDGEPVYFIRFVDFETPTPNTCDFHMVVVKGRGGTLHHRAHPMRIWLTGALPPVFEAAGFAAVSVSASIGDPDTPPSGEDVFVHAQA